MTRAQLEAAYPWSDRAPNRGRQRQHLDRVEDYLNIHGDYLTLDQAAGRLRIPQRAVVRIRATLRVIRANPAAGGRP